MIIKFVHTIWDMLIYSKFIYCEILARIIKLTFNTVPKGIESSESDVEEEKPVPKRARLEANNVEVIDKQAKFCDECGAQMKKKRYSACPNKCFHKCDIRVMNLSLSTSSSIQLTCMHTPSPLFIDKPQSSSQVNLAPISQTPKIPEAQLYIRVTRLIFANI
ncbi:hypothetical protein BpHYR1_015664, partial [Brachionus plicatilis]